MKKLVSILAAIAIMLTFSTVSFAATEFVMSAELEADSYAIGDEFEITLLGSEDVTGLGFDLLFDTSVFEVIETGANRKSISPESQVYSTGIGYAGGSASAIGVNLYLVLAVKEGAVTGDYEFKFVVDSANTTLDGVEFDSVSGEPFTIHIDGVEPAGNKMVALANTGAVESLNDDGWQKGQGIAATFNVADIKDFTAMNWKLTCNNIAAPKYAKVDNFAELIAAIGEESTVQFVATFVVNAIENEVETIYDITEVVAGFTADNGATVVEFTAPAAAN